MQVRGGFGRQAVTHAQLLHHRGDEAAHMTRDGDG
jgi:hypothetical protein